MVLFTMKSTLGTLGLNVLFFLSFFFFSSQPKIVWLFFPFFLFEFFCFSLFYAASFVSSFIFYNSFPPFLSHFLCFSLPDNCESAFVYRESGQWSVWASPNTPYMSLSSPASLFDLIEKLFCARTEDLLRVLGSEQVKEWEKKKKKERERKRRGWKKRERKGWEREKEKQK